MYILFLLYFLPSTICVELFVNGSLRTKPQVSHFNNERVQIREEYVLGLDVPVNDFIGVHVLDGGQDLTEDDASLGFVDATFG